jgi:glutathione peroxidase-family protein
MTTFHSLSMKSITGETVDFARYKGKVCLVVNLASR